MKLHRLLLTGFTLGFLTLSVRADAGFPWPRTDLDIRIGIENLHEYPQYDFYLKYGLGRGNPYASYRLTKVETRSLIRLEGKGDRFAGGVALIAVPSGVTVDAPKWGDGPQIPWSEWFEGKPPGGLQCILQTESGGRVSDSEHNCELTYRITIEGDQLTAVCVNSRNPTRRTWLAVGGLALSLFAVAAVIVIRRRRGASQPKAKS